MMEQRVLLTGDQDDFLEHYRPVSNYPGLILLYPSVWSQSAENMAGAIENIAKIYDEPVGLILSLTDFCW
jgi:hypothetical protein